MGDNFKIVLEAMIDQSSLTNAQKQVAKERLKIGADISVEDFAKSKQAIEKQMVDLAKGIKTILDHLGTYILWYRFFKLLLLRPLICR